MKENKLCYIRYKSEMLGTVALYDVCSDIRQASAKAQEFYCRAVNSGNENLAQSIHISNQ